MKNNLFNLLKKEFPRLQKNVSLKNHTTFKIGGPAEYFLVIKDKEYLIKALKVAKKLKLPVFVLGGGSNLLVSDEGIKGLVIKINNKKINFLGNNKISADSGVALSKLVEFSVGKSLSGLEWAGGLPGTFGGAIRGNAGAFSGEIKDSILWVEALDSQFNLKKISKKKSQFSYRSSIFKEKNWIVVSAVIKLKNGNKKTLQEIIQSRINYRRDKHPLNHPNAGSIFKNVDLNKFSLKLKESLASVVKNDPLPVVPTAHLIFQAGLKGRRIGNAQISEKHPNFIVNLGGATAEDVLGLISLVKREIKKIYRINLETECMILK